jgi:polar amino acid transport system substrate-binding protein
VKKITLVLISFCLATTAAASEPVLLANDAWPPFIVEGEQQGTAEKLVCAALQRAGRDCSVQVNDWDTVLEQARSGAIDGIAAAWRNPERETYLLFSEPYLTNRIVPVIDANRPVEIKTVSDLAGLRVAMVNDYAYGDEIEAKTSRFELIAAKNASQAIETVRSGKANVALVDELVARDLLADEVSGVVATSTVLAFRSLHFAVSKQNPEAEQIIADFQRAYQLMLADGSVNEILNVDWLATDFGHAGSVAVVMRSGMSLDDLSHPSKDGSVYALEKSEYQIMRDPDVDPSRVKYQVAGNSYSSLQSAINDVFGKNTACQHKEFSSEFDCTNLFKNR